MKMRSAMSAVLACLVSSLVAAWLLGSLVNYVFDEMGPAGQDVLMLVNAPWFGAKRAEIRRMDPITVIGHRDSQPDVTATARIDP
jgi:hypothetical protein